MRKKQVRIKNSFHLNCIEGIITLFSLLPLCETVDSAQLHSFQSNREARVGSFDPYLEARQNFFILF